VVVTYVGLTGHIGSSTHFDDLGAGRRREGNALVLWWIHKLSSIQLKS
jgi:hypothetical protein